MADNRGGQPAMQRSGVSGKDLGEKKLGRNQAE